MLRRPEQGDENYHSKALQKARLAKNMTQAQLAQTINEKPSVIADYEGGRAIPNGQVISRLSRALDSQLPKAKAAKAKSEH